MNSPFRCARGNARPWRHAIAALALLLLPHGALAQGPRFLTDTLPPGDPIGLLLARGAELQLTADQVTRLREIQRRLHAANDPLVTQLVAIRHEVWSKGFVHPRDMTVEQRAAFRAAVQRARPLMQAIGRNNVRAMEEVGTALSPEQKSMVRAWLRAAPGPRAGRGMPFRGRGGRRGRGRRWMGVDSSTTPRGTGP